MGDQPVPVAVAMGGALNMAGLVGQDALGRGQGHWVFVDDGVVGTGFAVLGHIEQGIDAMGGPITPPTSTTPPAGYRFYKRKGALVLAGNIHRDNKGQGYNSAFGPVVLILELPAFIHDDIALKVCLANMLFSLKTSQISVVGVNHFAYNFPIWIENR